MSDNWKLNTLNEVTGLVLNEWSIYRNAEAQALSTLEPLSVINIFVGANNSGKSRFMRKLAEYETHRPIVPTLPQIRRELQGVFTIAKTAFAEFGALGFGSITLANLDEISRVLSQGEFSMEKDAFAGARTIVDSWTFDRSSPISPPMPYPNAQDKLFQATHELVSGTRELLGGIPRFDSTTSPVRVYIPIMRGLRPLSAAKDHKDFYAEATKADYFRDIKTGVVGEEFSSKDLEIYTGLGFFERLKSLRLGTTKDRRSVDGYESFLSKTFFEGNAVELIPSQSLGVVTIKIGNEAERPIHDLGDGIQAAVILSFLPYVLQERTAFFFIEEPEMCMHPGLQRKVLGFFADQHLHKYFLTTHSNHLLDLTTDIKSVSVFTLKKSKVDSEDEEITPSFELKSINAGCKSSLDLLGVRNSSVFLVNSTIWVEGITDRFYLRRMLEQYMGQPNKRKFEEDVHFCFVEYGGSNIIHWSFLDLDTPQIEVERLCGQAMVIVDRDGGKKLERKEKIKAKLGKDRFIELDGREIENTLSYDVIRSVVYDYENDEDLVLRNFNYESYRDRNFGNFVESRMLKNEPKRRGGYQEDSGTLKNKLGFCERAVPLITYDALPLPTKNVVAKIYSFILQQNEGI